jgi:hypothetical protein
MLPCHVWESLYRVPNKSHPEISMEKSILYFETAGEENTEATLRAARERATQLGIKDVVVATTHGETAIRARDVFGPDANIVAVTICESFSEKGWSMSREEHRRLVERGISVLTASHALGDGVASAIVDKYGGGDLVKAVRDTLYRFGQGMKVCVEVALMAADAGLIPVDGEVIAIAGTGEGADTCIVVKPAYPRKFYELEVREIVAKPRSLS